MAENEKKSEAGVQGNGALTMTEALSGVEEPLKSDLRGAGFLAWALSVAGWLICAAFCLWAMVSLEAYPNAYDMFFYAIILILFCNIFLFLFVTARWGKDIKRLAGSIGRVVLGEAALLYGMFAIGKYLM